jgi:hypothetical protein
MVGCGFQEESGELKDHLPAIVGEGKTGLKVGRTPRIGKKDIKVLTA